MYKNFDLVCFCDSYPAIGNGHLKRSLDIIDCLKNKQQSLKISLMGVAYKADCDDTRNTPTERIVDFLKNRYHSHNIEYIAHDPWVREKDYKETELTADFDAAVKNSDVLLFATNHKQYYSIDLDDLKEKMKKEPIIIDGRNIFDNKIINSKGFIYRKIGEGSKHTSI